MRKSWREEEEVEQILGVGVRLSERITDLLWWGVVRCGYVSSCMFNSLSLLTRGVF